MTADTACPPLRLLAMDAEDLAIVSAHLQDAQIAVADLAYLAAERRFALAGHRYDWVRAAAGGCERVAVGLHFECVRAVARSGFAQEDDRVLNLLAIVFDPAEPPGGTILITFSGGAAIRLEVECVEAQMRDLGERRPCTKPAAHVAG